MECDCADNCYIVFLNLGYVYSFQCIFITVKKNNKNNRKLNTQRHDGNLPLLYFCYSEIGLLEINKGLQLYKNSTSTRLYIFILGQVFK